MKEKFQGLVNKLLQLLRRKKSSKDDLDPYLPSAPEEMPPPPPVRKIEEMSAHADDETAVETQFNQFEEFEYKKLISTDLTLMGKVKALTKFYLSIVVKELRRRFQQIKTKLISRDSSGGGDNGDGKGPDFNKGIQQLKKIEFDKVYDFIFGLPQRPMINNIFVIALLSTSFYLIGRTIALMVRPDVELAQSNKASMERLGPMKNYRQDFANVRKNDLFRAKGKVIKPLPDGTGTPKLSIDKNKKCFEADRKSNLSIKLMSTMVMHDSVKSLASVQVRSSDKYLSVREGEKINNDAEVGRIKNLKMVIKNLTNGNCEYIENIKSKLNKPNPILVERNPKKVLQRKKEIKDSRVVQQGNNFKIKKSYRDDALKNISEVLTQARAIEIKNPDGSLCFRIIEIQPGSIYSTLDIRNEDEICQINGKPIKSQNEVLGLFGRIKDVDHLELSVKREGSQSAMSYDFE